MLGREVPETLRVRRDLDSSEGSLHQHIKIKHPEIYTGEMEISPGHEHSES